MSVFLRQADVWLRDKDLLAAKSEIAPTAIAQNKKGITFMLTGEIRNKVDQIWNRVLLVLR